MLLIRSARLQETIVCIEGRQELERARAAHPDRVIYAMPEIEELAPHAERAQFIRGVHAVKKVFGLWDQYDYGAWIVPHAGHRREEPA